MNKKLYLILAMFLIVMGAMAEPISESEALAIAGKFLNSGSMHKAPAKSKALRLAAATTGYYAFNCGELDGYVIVAADDNATVDVLGYADSGTFDVNNMPENMKWWLSEYTRQMEYAAAKQLTGKTNVASKPRADITPLLTCTWNQYTPYNNMCPVIGGSRSVTGCVATAMSQIMYYHQWPQQGVGSHSYSYKISYDDGTIETITPEADFAGTTYNWTAMTDSYTSSSSKESCDAVAQLMYHAGVSVNMAYRGSISGASDVMVAKALSTYFDYDKSATCYSRSYFSINEWEDMIYTNLSAGQPVLYGGQDNNTPSSGHAFVCDGYKDGYFHINWGWGGMSDGYFTLTALTPDALGAGGGSGGYNYNQDAIMNIRKNQGGEYILTLGCLDDFWVNTSQATRGIQIEFTGGFQNYSVCDLQVTLGVKLVNKNDTEAPVYAKWIYAPSSVGAMGGYFPTIKLNTSQFPTADGEYIVTPAANVDGTWHDVHLNAIKNTGQLIAKIEGNNITFHKQANAASELNVSEITVTSYKKVFAGKEFSINAVITNTGGEYYGNMTAGITYVGGTTLLKQSGSILTDVEDHAKVDFVLTAPEATGNYDIVILDADNNIIGRNTIEVEAAQALAITVNSLTMADKECVNPNDMHLTASLTCNGSYYNGKAMVYIFPYADGKVYSVGYFTANVNIEAGETKTIDFQLSNFDGCTYGSKYWVSSIILGSAQYNTNTIIFTLANKIDKDIPAASHFASFSASANTIVPEGVEVYKASIGNESVHLTKVETDVIPANTGVILYSEKPSTKAFITTLKSSAADFSGNELIPTSTSATVPSSGTFYALLADAPQFARLQNGIVLTGNKAYLQAPDSYAKPLSIEFGDPSITGIGAVNKEEGCDSYYTLQGVKVAEPGKGIYIKNGKKILIK